MYDRLIHEARPACCEELLDFDLAVKQRFRHSESIHPEFGIRPGAEAFLSHSEMLIPGWPPAMQQSLVTAPERVLEWANAQFLN